MCECENPSENGKQYRLIAKKDGDRGIHQCVDVNGGLADVTGGAEEPAEQSHARAAEEEPSDPRESGIPQVSILPRHRTRLDTAEKPIAHHEVTTSAKLLHERRQVREIIAVVGVTHDDETATSDA